MHSGKGLFPTYFGVGVYRVGVYLHACRVSKMHPGVTELMKRIIVLSKGCFDHKRYLKASRSPGMVIERVFLLHWAVQLTV